MNNKPKKFKVLLSWTQINQAEIEIEAKSLKDAQEKAEEIQSDEVNNWNPIDGQVEVISVKKA